MQIVDKSPRILVLPKDFVNNSMKALRLHPECLVDATKNPITNFCRLFSSLDSADRAAIYAAAGQIINASSVRSPPFLPFRPPTPSRACTQVGSAGGGAEVASDSDSDSDAQSIGVGNDEFVSDTDSDEQPIGEKRPFEVVVDDDIEIEEGQYRAQMVRWSCQLQLQSLRRRG